jgi:hypothetical protein
MENANAGQRWHPLSKELADEHADHCLRTKISTSRLVDQQQGSWRKNAPPLKLKAAGTRCSARGHRFDEKPEKKTPPDFSGGADVFRQV